MLKIWPFHGGIHPPQHKTESSQRPVAAMSIPPLLTLPLHQHIGQSAKPVVEAGDYVLKGQLIAKADGFVSAPIHAPTSGTVVSIKECKIPHPSGLSALCALLETDGKDQWCDRHSINDYASLDPSELRNIIRNAGIVGLGGAGFPTFIKLNPGPDKCVDTLIINGVECEPYISCDDLLMRTEAEEIIAGIKILQYALQARHCVIAIEDNKAEAIAHLDALLKDEPDIEVASIPTQYPAGSEKQLIQSITGKEVPKDGLAIHVGVIGQNVATTRAVYRAVMFGEPLISRIMTVTGDAVQTPQNFEALFGTPFAYLLQRAEARIEHIERLTMGGPMMGFAVRSTEVPVIKTTNCILAQTKSTLPKPQPAMPCIRCGACAEACPVSLLPQQLYWFARSNDLERAQSHKLFDCIECGCCSYVCPSHIPLVQHYRYAKGQIWIKEQDKKKADIARQRHESRQARLARQKAEQAAKREQKKAAIKARAAKKAAQDMAEKQRDKALQSRDNVQEVAQQRRETIAVTNASTPETARSLADSRPEPK